MPVFCQILLVCHHWPEVMINMEPQWVINQNVLIGMSSLRGFQPHPTSSRVKAKGRSLGVTVPRFSPNPGCVDN